MFAIKLKEEKVKKKKRTYKMSIGQHPFTFLNRISPLGEFYDIVIYTAPDPQKKY